MNAVNARDLDLNLLRVFFAVAESGGVTAAAKGLYLTQPALSAALKRLGRAVGGALFVRQGRGMALTARGERLASVGRPHFDALLQATLTPATFDPKTSNRIVRLGLADTGVAWLLPSLLRAFATESPSLRLVVLPVQFRTVPELLGRGAIDLAVTVADELPDGIERQPLFHGGFVVLFDPRHTRLGRTPSLTTYLAHHHVVVSYNGDLHGVVEDILGIQRKVRVSVSSFRDVGGLIEGSALLATVPETVALTEAALRPVLRTAKPPLAVGGAPMELLRRTALEDDEALRFVRRHIERIAAEHERTRRHTRFGTLPARRRSGTVRA